MVYQFRLLAFGFWLLAFGFWRLAFGVWLLAFGVWRLALRSCGYQSFKIFLASLSHQSHIGWHIFKKFPKR